jgi:quercetin dioxygenase-like cupin family protein
MRLSVSALMLVLAGAGAAWAQDEFVVTKLAEMPVAELPADPLYWQVSKFGSLAEAQAAAGAHALAAEAFDAAWLFSLSSGEPTAAPGEVMAVIGPVPRVEAKSYLLRVNSGVGKPGTKTSVHTHPGAEAFYVLEGQLTQHLPGDPLVLDAGGTAAGEPNVPMQVESTGAVELHELIMFVVDDEAPFSSPATLD